ncbi:zinc finger protein CONSTANS-LIKE 4-like [Rhodamnia argentea]|uniref:Zinc finger protein CONSTANS-LIKE 4-like n=1 Tax=Rhodamnia argentea TaxID=178133 RepID=A0A8B8P9D4_9MYRT|nr:zinc finger protein CONSTANS-LIKE 4-like [Rhodamnia argentea]
MGWYCSMMGFTRSWSMPTNLGNSCKSTVAGVFYRVDAAFLCLGCDSRIPGSSKLSERHERFWMCEVCEQALAAVTCKANQAALCVTYEANIPPKTNPLAHCHERMPMEPFLNAAGSISKVASAFNFLAVPSKIGRSATCGGGFSGACENEELEATSWIFLNTIGMSSNKIAREWM